MEEYQKRVVEEKLELDGRIRKLNSFLEAEHFENINSRELNRLFRQCDLMVLYSAALNERIISF